MAVPDAVLVAVSGVLSRGARRYAIRRAGRELGKFLVWAAACAAAAFLAPRQYRVLALGLWGMYVAGAAAALPARRWVSFVCPPGVVLRRGVELFVWALSRSGGELARAAAWLVVAGQEGREAERPRWLRAEVEEPALAFLLGAGVARREGDEIVYAEPGELIRGPSGDAEAATSSPTDRSRAGSLPR